MNFSCAECGGVARVVSGARIYPHRRDLFDKSFWLCACGAYVGCHPGTQKPLGAPSGAQLRRAKIAAHAAFDPLWKSGEMIRAEAYAWLARGMGLRGTETHIGYFTVEQCRTVVRLCSERPQRAEAQTNGCVVNEVVIE